MGNVITKISETVMIHPHTLIEGIQCLLRVHQDNGCTGLSAIFLAQHWLRLAMATPVISDPYFWASRVRFL